MADIKFFDVIEVIGNLIQNNVTDPAGKPRWVYPTFPKETSNLPQVTLELQPISFENDSSGSFGEESSGDPYKEYYYKKATALLNVYIISGKFQEFTIGSLYLKEQKLNMYLGEQVKNLLWNQYEVEGTFKNDFEEVKLLDYEPSFDNGKFSWASKIQTRVKYKDTWVKEYTGDDIVADYSLTVATYC